MTSDRRGRDVGGAQLPDGEPVAEAWRNIAVAELGTFLGTGGSPQRPAIVAIDGRSASGKSTVAARLVEAVPPAHVVHTDDVAWWHSFFGWDDMMRSSVLQPLHRGAAVRFRPPAWIERGRPGAISVPADARLVVLEGVGQGGRISPTCSTSSSGFRSMRQSGRCARRCASPAVR